MKNSRQSINCRCEYRCRFVIVLSSRRVHHFPFFIRLVADLFAVDLDIFFLLFWTVTFRLLTVKLISLTINSQYLARDSVRVSSIYCARLFARPDSPIPSLLICAVSLFVCVTRRWKVSRFVSFLRGQIRSDEAAARALIASLDGRMFIYIFRWIIASCFSDDAVILDWIARVSVPLTFERNLESVYHSTCTCKRQ